MSVPTRVADLSRWRKILPHPARTTAVPCVVRLRCETCVRTNEQKCQRFVNLRKLVMIIARSSKSTQIGTWSLLRGWFGDILPAKRTSPIALRSTRALPRVYQKCQCDCTCQRTYALYGAARACPGAARRNSFKLISRLFKSNGELLFQLCGGATACRFCTSGR